MLGKFVGKLSLFDANMLIKKTKLGLEIMNYFFSP